MFRWDHGGPWQGAQEGPSGFAGCFWPCVPGANERDVLQDKDSTAAAAETATGL